MGARVALHLLAGVAGDDGEPIASQLAQSVPLSNVVAVTVVVGQSACVF